MNTRRMAFFSLEPFLLPAVIIPERTNNRLPQQMANSMSDEDLMTQVRSGIGEMLGVLFERYHVPLFNFYLKLTGDRPVSEDLVQEVFFRILKYRHSYRPDTAFRAWMYQIARNARVDLFRKRRPETSLEPEMSPAVAPVDSAQQSQEALLLHSALMQISEDKREVLILSRFQDLKYEEIAQLLGCEVGTVKTRVHRALQDLRQVFQQLESGKALRGKGSQGTWPAPGSVQ
ncbi:MAG TPA: RNA polymerase sigma factor [Candidatus Angelobacter sp.]